MGKIQSIQIEAGEYRWLQSAMKGIQFFSGMTIGQLDAILPAINLYRYPRRHAVFKEGQRGDAMYVVYQGSIAIRKKSGFLWFTRMLARVGPGQVFGEMALLDAAPRSASAIAFEDSKIFALFSVDFEFIAKKNPDLSVHMKRISEQRKFENQSNR